MAKTLGFIGIGQIGLPMARRLLQYHGSLTVCDVRASATQALVDEGATRAATAREVADQCEIVFLSLPSLKAFREVVLGDEGVLHGKAMKILVNMSTVGMPIVREMAAALEAEGKQLVDCPISGGVSGAAAGTLSVMVSGDPDSVATLGPFLAELGKATIAGDRPGAAQALKLTNNVLSIVAIVATSEAYVMGAKAGLDPEVMTAAIYLGSGRNSSTLDKFPHSVLTRRFNYGSELHIAMKDIDLAIELGEELGVPMWVCQAARLVLKHAMFDGAAHDDVMTLVQRIERVARFEIPQTRQEK